MVPCLMTLTDPWTRRTVCQHQLGFLSVLIYWVVLGVSSYSAYEQIDSSRFSACML